MATGNQYNDDRDMLDEALNTMRALKEYERASFAGFADLLLASLSQLDNEKEAESPTLTLRDFLTTLNSGDSAWLLYAERIAPDAQCAVIQSEMTGNMTEQTTPASDWICLGNLDSLSYEVRVVAGFVDNGEPEDDLECAWLITQAVDFLIDEWTTA